MFNSIEEALKVIQTLGKKGLIDNTEYQSAINYLKSNGYIISAIGLRENNKVWNYRAVRARINTLKSLNNQGCNRCIDEELFKGWNISFMKQDALDKIKLKENIDKYLF